MNDDELKKEQEAMELKDEQQALNVSVKVGRPKKPDLSGSGMLKTNLDLPAGLLSDLDRVVDYLGSTRQAVIKGFILQGIDQHYRSRSSQGSSHQTMVSFSTVNEEKIQTRADGSLKITKDVG